MINFIWIQSYLGYQPKTICRFLSNCENNEVVDWLCRHHPYDDCILLHTSVFFQYDRQLWRLSYLLGDMVTTCIPTFVSEAATGSFPLRKDLHVCNLLKRDCNTGVLLWNLQYFKNTYFEECLQTAVFLVSY